MPVYMKHAIPTQTQWHVRRRALTRIQSLLMTVTSSPQILKSIITMIIIIKTWEEGNEMMLMLCLWNLISYINWTYPEVTQSGGRQNSIRNIYPHSLRKLIAVKWKGILLVFNWERYKNSIANDIGIQIKMYWTEFIVEKTSYICINLHVQNFEIFCYHSCGVSMKVYGCSLTLFIF